MVIPLRLLRLDHGRVGHLDGGAAEQPVHHDGTPLLPQDPPPAPQGERRRSARGGSSSRAAATALRLANTVGAAIANRRVLADSERGVLSLSGIALLLLAALGLWWPRALAWPLAQASQRLQKTGM